MRGIYGVGWMNVRIDDLPVNYRPGAAAAPWNITRKLWLKIVFELLENRKSLSIRQQMIYVLYSATKTGRLRGIDTGTSFWYDALLFRDQMPGNWRWGIFAIFEFFFNPTKKQMRYLTGSRGVRE